MEKRLTVRIPEELDRTLRQAAHRSQRTASEVVRLALRSYLESVPNRPGWAYDRVRDLIGSFNSDIPDLAQRHSEYVLESLKRRR